MSICIQERVGTVYTAAGSVGSATYDYPLTKFGGHFGGPVSCQIGSDTWAGSVVMSVSLDGTTFVKPNWTDIRVGTAGMLNEVAGPVAGPVTLGTAWLMTYRVPVKVLRIGAATVSGTVNVAWSVLAF
jgi:hypothetical protein